MKTNWRLEAVLLAIVAAMFVAAAVSWSGAPGQIPVHWNVHGQVDRYGGRAEGLLFPPLLALGIYLAMRYLPAIDPGRANYARFAGAYAALRTAIVLLVAAFYALALNAAHGGSLDVSRVMPVAVGALFIVTGSLMGKLRPNWFVGIRTPWTLSSKQAWVRTHRLGGFLFLAIGVAFVGTGLFHVAVGGPLIAVAVVGSAVVLFAYSYVVWRSDPEKTPPAGTQPADDTDVPMPPGPTPR